jgi:hypothetical protein
MNFPSAPANNPLDAGSQASDKTFFGEFDRYALFAVHTRFDAVQWFVADAELPDPVTGKPSIIRQAATPEEAVAGLRFNDVL